MMTCPSPDGVHFKMDIHSRFIFLFASLFLFFNVFSASKAYGQESFLLGNVLLIPQVYVDGDIYRVEMQLVQNVVPTEFEVLAYAKVADGDGYIENEFYDGFLFVSDLRINDQSYWLELEQVSESSFVYFNHGLNKSLSQNSFTSADIQPNWLRMDGGASDIGIGADGSVWVVGTDERPGGYGIYFWSGNRWQRVDGAAVRIDVGPSGNPWIVNDSHQIYFWNGSGWTRVHGDARDVGVGADGTVWIAAGGGIYRWDGYDWERTSGSAVRIDVDPYGTPWVIDHTDDVYELINGQWIRRPGAARDIGIGPDGAVWVIGTSGGSGGHDIFRWNGSEWIQVFGSARQISVDPFGVPWVLGTGGEIYQGR